MRILRQNIVSLLKAYKIKIMGRKPSKCTGAKKKKKQALISYHIREGEKVERKHSGLLKYET